APAGWAPADDADAGRERRRRRGRLARRAHVLRRRGPGDEPGTGTRERVRGAPRGARPAGRVRPRSAVPLALGTAALARWLLIRGVGSRPLDRHVDPGAIRSQSSSKRPSVQPGELAILYASVWQAIYGVVEIASVPEHDPT